MGLDWSKSYERAKDKEAKEKKNRPHTDDNEKKLKEGNGTGPHLKQQLVENAA